MFVDDLKTLLQVYTGERTTIEGRLPRKVWELYPV